MTLTSKVCARPGTYAVCARARVCVSERQSKGLSERVCVRERERERGLGVRGSSLGFRL